jgi:hypothetical protein
MAQKRFTLTVHGDVIDTCRERVIPSVLRGWLNGKYYIALSTNPPLLIVFESTDINNPLAYNERLPAAANRLTQYIKDAVPIRAWISLTTANDPPETLDDLDLIPKNGKE